MIRTIFINHAKHSTHTFRGFKTAVARKKCIHPTRAFPARSAKQNANAENGGGTARRSYEARVYESMIIDAYRRITLR